MLFNSLIFVVFFFLVLCLYYYLQNWSYRKAILLLASYFFYASWNPPFVFILWLSTVIDWYAGKSIERSQTTARKRFFVTLSLCSNLGLLAFFKYGNFILENTVFALNSGGIKTSYEPMDIILPVGISFYTFQTLSYTLDIYRGNLKSARSFLDFSLYVTFFPQLVAGPIVRAVDFIPQCEEPKRPSANHIGWGLYFMTLGLFQKVVLADVFLAPASESVFNWSKGALHTFDAWIGVMAFTGQIFFDFAGYSTCAIGASICLGFLLPDNFRFPYAAIGFSDFWKRWHISLSSWLKDYLYISLGGNRRGKVRTMINLMLTMLIGGLWHGASWTFVVWGGLHGIFLTIEHFLKEKFSHIHVTASLIGRLGVGFVTLLLVAMTWVFFRAPDFKTALMILSSLWGLQSGVKILPTVEIASVITVMTLLIVAHWYMRESRIETLMEKMPRFLIITIWSLMLFGLVVTQGGSNAFIYFQF